MELTPPRLLKADDYLELEPPQCCLSEIDTPTPLIDLDVVEKNVRRLQTHLDQQNLSNRPHIKTHKLSGLARYQMAEGASGITAQKLGEAEVMANAGISDILLTFNVVGDTKRSRLAELMRRSSISVVADGDIVVDGLAWAARNGGRTLSVLVECDTGAGRAGVQSPVAAAELGRLIASTPGLQFNGLMTYPKPGTRRATAAFLEEAKVACSALGLSVTTISTGGSPDQWSVDGLSVATEYRAGTSIYCDRSLVERGTSRLEDCALTVLTTVVSRPTATRALIDAGSKSLTSDLLGLDGHGLIIGHRDITIGRLDEEHGYLEVQADCPITVGDRLRVLPNHVCPVSNLFDRVGIMRQGRLLGFVAVDARGLVS